MTTPLIAEFDALSERQFTELSRPGVWWTGAQKTAIAATTRAAMNDADGRGGLSGPAEEAIRRIATDAISIRRDDVERWDEEGMQVEAYVELVGIVVRIAALDSAAFGLGLDETNLATPSPGEPSRERVDGAEYTDGWVPTTGPAYPPTALSAVPGATELLFDVHGVLYLALADMGSHSVVRDGMSRAQIELAASRTSYLNDCFY